MSTRYYPLYQKGNPRLRVFLPNFWMKLIKPEEALPPNVVLFRTSIEMTKYDVKNYLEKIYKVPVVDIRLEIKMGTIKRCPGENHLIKDDDYKEALVFMPKDYKFEFPKISDSDVHKKEMKRYKQTKEAYLETKRKENKPGFFPGWFYGQ